MDQMMILTEHYHKVGTKVELYGDHISMVQRADELNTIVYELITGLSDRLSRIYIFNNQMHRIVDPRY